MLVLVTVLLYSSLSCFFIVHVCGGDCLGLFSLFLVFVAGFIFSLSCARDCLGLFSLFLVLVTVWVYFLSFMCS